jgi:hypothetical protein
MYMCVYIYKINVYSKNYILYIFYNCFISYLITQLNHHSLYSRKDSLSELSTKAHHDQESEDQCTYKLSTNKVLTLTIKVKLTFLRDVNQLLDQSTIFLSFRIISI